MIGGYSSSYPVVYRVSQIVVVKIIEPKRYALRPEEVVIAALLANRNGRIKACREIQQIQRSLVTGMNVQSKRAQAFEIRPPRHLSQMIRAAFTVAFDLHAASFDQAFQDPT